MDGGRSDGEDESEGNGYGSSGGERNKRDQDTYKVREKSRSKLI